MRADEHGEVGVLRAQGGIVIAVPINNGYAAFVMLLADKAAGIHAERAHLVFKRIGIVYKLCFIQRLCKMIHYGIGHLNAHAYIYLVIAHADIQPVALILKPLCAAPAGSRHYIACIRLLLFARMHIAYARGMAVFNKYVVRRGAAYELKAGV